MIASSVRMSASGTFSASKLIPGQAAARWGHTSASGRAAFDISNYDTGRKAAMRNQRMQDALLKNAIERRSNYFADLAALCGTAGRADVGLLVTQLQTLTKQENEVRDGFAKLRLVQEIPDLRVMAKLSLADKQRSFEHRLSMLRASSACVCAELRSSIASSIAVA